MDIQISKLNNADKLCRFLEKVDGSFPIPLSSKIELSVLSDKLCTIGIVFAAHIDGELAGIIGLYANDSETKTAYFSVLAVLNEYSGKGIASQLLQNAVEEAKLCGMRKVRLYTHKTNKGAIHLYKKAGFHENYDENRPCDILFTLELNN